MDDLRGRGRAVRTRSSSDLRPMCQVSAAHSVGRDLETNRLTATDPGRRRLGEDASQRCNTPDLPTHPTDGTYCRRRSDDDDPSNTTPIESDRRDRTLEHAP